ncbi:MAG: hypothetical protein FWF50_05735 [Defluviitaleaceae bacterium]|nr:hypothetical protein [Defluviitaleaceae bacterium]
MKKIGAALAICFVFLFASNAYANYDENLIRTGLEDRTDITWIINQLYEEHGFNAFGVSAGESLLFNILIEAISNSEVTFDRVRTITGNHTYGSVLRFIVLTSEGKVYFDETLTVGISGVFSIDINFAENYNVVVIVVTPSDYDGNSHFASIVRRLPSEVRDGLLSRTRALVETGINE